MSAVLHAGHRQRDGADVKDKEQCDQIAERAIIGVVEQPVRFQCTQKRKHCRTCGGGVDQQRAERAEMHGLGQRENIRPDDRGAWR